MEEKQIIALIYIGFWIVVILIAFVCLLVDLRKTTRTGTEVVRHIIGWMIKVFLLIFLQLCMVGLGGIGPISSPMTYFIKLIQGPWFNGFLIVVLVLGGLAWLFFGLPALFGALFSGGDRETWKVTRQGKGSYTVQGQGKGSFDVTVQEQGKGSYTIHKR